MYAGADAFLMPSRFEPCGQGQMISLRYGTLPVVRATGGLRDTVIDVDADPENGTGFVFGPAEPVALAEACRRAMDVLRRRAAPTRAPAPRHGRRLLVARSGARLRADVSARDGDRRRTEVTGHDVWRRLARVGVVVALLVGAVDAWPASCGRSDARARIVFRHRLAVRRATSRHCPRQRRSARRSPVAPRSVSRSGVPTGGSCASWRPTSRWKRARLPGRGMAATRVT